MLVARGFKREAGLDFSETYSPVTLNTSIRTSIAIAAQRKLKIKQFDMTTAFLYGTLEGNIYIKAPQGLTVEDNQALKLVKGLYSLEQSPRVWIKEFKSKKKQLLDSHQQDLTAAFSGTHSSRHLCVHKSMTT